MPPSMQLENKTPRHANRSLQRRQRLADDLVDIPEYEARDEEDGAPCSEFLHFATDGAIGHAVADY